MTYITVVIPVTGPSFLLYGESQKEVIKKIDEVFAESEEHEREGAEIYVFFGLLPFKLGLEKRRSGFIAEDAVFD